jgi:hypothetical protein
MPDLTPSPMVVELGPTTMKKLGAIIEDAVRSGFDSVFVPPERAIDIDTISQLAVEEIKRAIHEVLDERADEGDGEGA